MNSNNSNNTQYSPAEIQQREAMKKKNAARNSLFNETTNKFKAMANQLHMIFSTSAFENKDARIIVRDHIFGFVEAYGKAYSDYVYSADRYSVPKSVNDVMNLSVQMDKEINDELMKLNIGDFNKNNHDNLIVRLQQELYQDHQTNTNMPDDLETLIDYMIDEYRHSKNSVATCQDNINRLSSLTRDKIVALKSEIDGLKNNDLSSNLDVANVQITQLNDELMKKDVIINDILNDRKSVEMKMDQLYQNIARLENVNDYYRNQVAILKERSNVTATPLDLSQSTTTQKQDRADRRHRKRRDNICSTSASASASTSTSMATPTQQQSRNYAKPASVTVDSSALDALSDLL